MSLERQQPSARVRVPDHHREGWETVRRHGQHRVPVWGEGDMLRLPAWRPPPARQDSLPHIAPFSAPRRQDLDGACRRCDGEARAGGVEGANDGHLMEWRGANLNLKGHAQLSSRARCNVPDVAGARMVPGEKPPPVGRELEEIYRTVFGVLEHMEGLEGIGIPEAYNAIVEPGRDYIAHGGPCTLCSVASPGVSFEHSV